MKVLNVVDGSGWTGGVEQTMILCRELRLLGVDARMAAHRDNPVLAEAAEAGIPAYVYDEGRGAIPRARRLLELLAEEYDFIVGHKPAAIRHVALPRLLTSRRAPLIGVRRVSFPVSPLTVYRLPSEIVAVAGKVRDVLRESGLRRVPITVIPSGVDVEKFRPDAGLGAETRERLGMEGSTILLSLAKFVPDQKGQDILLKATAGMENMAGTKIIMAGLETDGDEAKRLVRSHGLEEETMLLGFRRDIPGLLNAADIFVFPSLPGLDAIAGSVLQAMACGRVAVASDVGGIGEYLRDGENGFLVPPGDAPALGRALTKALGLAGHEREEMGRKARETILAGYSSRSMAEEYLNLFRGMQSLSNIPRRQRSRQATWRS
jgi:glycosyltransferase involved in cell wall biosynthesis